MWPRIAQTVAKFQSVVVTGLDADGYPYSVRCQPKLLEAEQVIAFDLPDHPGIQPGPASLMGHTHDEQLWSLSSFLVRGALERRGAGWVLRPKQFTPGASQNPLDMVRLLVNCRRTAANYLKKRQLPRPQVNWHQIDALWAEAEQVRKSQP